MTVALMKSFFVCTVPPCSVEKDLYKFCGAFYIHKFVIFSIGIACAGKAYCTYIKTTGEGLK